MTSTQNSGYELRKVTEIPSYEHATSMYEVAVDGQVIGYVAKRSVTRERHTPGRRYVDARWQSPPVWCRKAAKSGHWFECGSRKSGAESLVRNGF